MKIVVTGATGYVGQHFIPAFIERDPDVEIMTVNRDPEKAAELFPQKQCIHVSVGEMERIPGFAPEMVYHLATLSTSRNDLEIIAPMLEANIGFGVKLLHYVSQCPSLRLFVNTGTFAEYRSGVQRIDDAYLYAATKTAFRNFVEYYSRLNDFKYVHVVPYTVYGGRDRAKKMIDYIIESIDASAPVAMTRGEQILDFIHVDDVVSFFLCLADHLSLFGHFPNGEEFHIGTGKGTQIREVASIVEKVFNRRCNIQWGGRPYRDRDTMQSVAPITKNLEMLQWRASISLEDGISRMKEERNL